MCASLCTQQPFRVSTINHPNLFLGEYGRQCLIHLCSQANGARRGCKESVAAVQEFLWSEHPMHREDLTRHRQPSKVKPELLPQEFGGIRKVISHQSPRGLGFGVDEAQCQKALQDGGQYGPTVRNDPLDIVIRLCGTRQYDVRERACGVKEKLKIWHPIVVHQWCYPVGSRCT